MSLHLFLFLCIDKKCKCVVHVRNIYTQYRTIGSFYFFFLTTEELYFCEKNITVDRLNTDVNMFHAYFYT